MLDLEVGVSTLMYGKQPVRQLLDAVAKYLRKTADEKKWLSWLLASKVSICLVVFQLCGEAENFIVEGCIKGGKLLNP